jgi:hypothetical protein
MFKRTSQVNEHGRTRQCTKVYEEFNGIE